MKYILFFIIILMSFVSKILSQDTLSFILIKDIHNNSSYPRELTVLNDKLIFVASGDSVGLELFKSDGTTNGTGLLKNINTYHQVVVSESDNGSNPNELTLFGDKIIFCANDDIHGYEPWITDGTSQGTFLLKDIKPENPYTGSNDGSYPSYFTEFNNNVYFLADYWGDQLFVSNGTPEGTSVVKQINGASPIAPPGFTVYNNKLFYNYCDSNNTGDQLWCSDGTSSGTHIFKVINEVNSSPSGFYVYKNKLYFTAQVDSIGRELWNTDGSETGTVLFKDINLNEGMGSYPRGFTICNDKLFFTAADSMHGIELWCTDGDTVYMVKDISPKIGAMAYSRLHEFNGRLYFKARMTEFSDHTLWVSDGTPEGTYELLSNDSTPVEEPASFIEWQNTLIFIAQRTHTENYQLWMTNGTSEMTQQIFPDSVSGWSPNHSSNMIIFKDALYLSAKYNDTIGNELYKLILDSTKLKPRIYYGPLTTNSCIGGKARFEVKTLGRLGRTYQWKKNGIPIPGAIEPWHEIDSVAISDTGSYTCYIQNNMGAIESSPAYLDLFEFFDTNIISAPSFIQQKDTAYITYVGNPSKTAEYNWNFDSGVIVEGKGMGPYKIMWADTGIKTIELRITDNNCVSNYFTKKLKVIKNQNSIFISNSDGNFLVYPNPANRELTISTKDNSRKKIIYLQDVNGRIIASFEKNDEIIKLNLTDLKRGFYLIKIITDNTIFIKKFLKQ